MTILLFDPVVPEPTLQSTGTGLGAYIAGDQRFLVFDPLSHSRMRTHKRSPEESRANAQLIPHRV